MKKIPPPPQRTDVCSNCRHAEATSGTKQRVFICRRFPPTAQIVPNGRGGASVVSPFPEMGADQWCGEFTLDTLRPLARLQ
jgi:hypothetical protein